MIDVKVKTKNVKFSVPIPYSILNLSISIISSNTLTRLIEKNNKAAITIPSFDKQLLKQMIRELKKHKGTELVNIKAKDGTEIKVIL